MAYFNSNSVFRILSPIRAGTLPPSKLNTTTAAPKKSPNMYLTLPSSGSSTNPVMQPAATDSTSGVISGQLWFFRQTDKPFPNRWTIHCLAKGEGQCLQRVDPESGALKMGELTSGSVFPAQVWHIETSTKGSVSVSNIMNRPDTQPPPDPNLPWPMKLDVKWGEDTAVAYDWAFKGKSPNNAATNLPWTEGTQWDIQYVRPIVWKTVEGKQIPN